MSKKQNNTEKEKVENPEMECTGKTEEPKILNVSMSTITGDEPDYKDLYLRTLADMDNLRKNTNKRISEIYSTANEKLVVEMLPYLDALDLAVMHEKENGSGYEVLKKQLINILEKFGVKEIEIKAVEKFNESKMNAIMTIQTQHADLHNKVYEVVKKGYMLFDKVIRYTDVVVYNYAAV